MTFLKVDETRQVQISPQHTPQVSLDTAARKFTAPKQLRLHTGNGDAVDRSGSDTKPKGVT